MSIAATALVFIFALAAWLTGIALIVGLFADLAADIRKGRPHRLGAAGRVTHQEGAPGEY